MRYLIERFKAMGPRLQSLFKISVAFIFIIIFTAYGAFTLNNQAELLPENPLSNVINNNSQVPLLSGFKDLIHAEELSDDKQENDETPENQEETEEKEQEEINETDEKNNQPTETQERQQLQPADEHTDSSENNEDSQQQQANDETESDEPGLVEDDEDANSDAPNIEITDPNDEHKENEINQYFTTSIINDETVTSENYSFFIRQLDHDFQVNDINVHVQPDTGTVDHITDDYDSSVQVNLTLTKGENEITVGVIYEDDAGEEFTVVRDYVVYFDEERIVIHTDLEDQEVYDSNLSFNVNATAGDEDIPVTVKVNGETITANDTTYQTELNEGQNEIIIEAEHNGLQESEQFTIQYQKPNLTIETDLQNQTVNLEDFTFQAKGFDDSERIGLEILHDSVEITENDEGQYTVTLSEGENEFQLTAAKGGLEHTETYQVFYTPESNPDSDPEENENAPTITVHDIEHGDTIKNQTRTFHVVATDYKGKSITASNGTVSATNNGTALPVDWQDGSKISYTLTLVNGDNHIVVTATDLEGNTATEELTVYGDIVEEGGVVGTATISLEATTVGLGHIIPAQEVEIYQGERGSHVITRLFNGHGIDYDYTGEHDNSFYLSAIYREGLVNNPVIPEDLAALVERDFSRFEPDDYLPDSLGEFDFTNGSGWMYSVNGIYPNVGFADYYFKDGDTVRIRYTIALGADIGGGMPGNNYGKEW